MAMTSTPRELPRIDYFALGGTIASTPGAGRSGAAPALTAESLLQSVPAMAGRAKIHARQFLQVPSCEIEFADLLRLHAAIGEAVAQGAQGIVITQGTDTLEETAALIRGDAATGS